MHTVNIEITERIHQVVPFKRSKTTGKSLDFQVQKVVTVAYRRWSFSRDSNRKSLTGKVLVFWIGSLLYIMGVGRLLEVVAHGGSTVYTFLLCAGSKWLVISFRAVEFQLFLQRSVNICHYFLTKKIWGQNNKVTHNT